MADNMKRERRTANTRIHEEPEPADLFPCMTVGVMGSVGGTLEEEVRQPVRQLEAAMARAVAC